MNRIIPDAHKRMLAEKRRFKLKEKKFKEQSLDKELIRKTLNYIEEGKQALLIK